MSEERRYMPVSSEMVTCSFRYPGAVQHDPSQRCGESYPHSISECGEFEPVATPTPARSEAAGGEARAVVQQIVSNYAACLKREAELLKAVGEWAVLLGLDGDHASCADVGQAITSLRQQLAAAREDGERLALATLAAAREGERAATLRQVASELRAHASTAARISCSKRSVIAFARGLEAQADAITPARAEAGSGEVGRDA